MKLRLQWLWSWFCFRAVMLWPGDLLRWPFGSMLPWAGVYANGSKQMHVTIDHQAWLRGVSPDRTIHVALNMTAHGVPDVEARQILDAMIAGLNAKFQP